MRAVFLSMLLLVSPAHADLFDGNELLNLCKTVPLRANGYIAGIYDKSLIDSAAAEFWGLTRENKDNLKKAVRPYCVPDGVRLSQFHDIVCKYLEEFPQHRHYAASSLVDSALTRAFPCR